jgi:natural product biosynthesis luciferase-like monooxygenase protein
MPGSPAAALTPIQQGMVFHYLIHPHDGVDVEQIRVTLQEDADIAVLEQAWHHVIAAHPALRSTIVETSNGDHALATRETFTPALSALDPETDLEAWLERDRLAGFDLLNEVPLRLAVMRRGAHDAILVWSFHHILLDGRSFPDVLCDVLDAYDRLRQGSAPQIQARPAVQPYLEWLARQDADAALSYWRDLLAGHPGNAPLSTRGPLDPAHRGKIHQERVLAPALTAELRERAEKLGVTLNTLVQAAWGTALARYTGQDTVVFGATRAGRAGHVADAERMLGVFINTVPVRADVANRTGFDLLRALRAQQLGARAHDHVSLAAVQQAVRTQQPLFDTLLMFDREVLDASMQRLRPGWATRSFELRERTPYPVTLYAYAEPTLLLRLAYEHGSLLADEAVRLLAHVENLLVGMAREPAVPLRQLAMLTDAERQRISDQRARTDRHVPDDTVDGAFTRTAAARPDAVALRLADQQYSYAQLAAAAERVAAALEARDVAPGAIVGISLDRSAALVAALLGTLRAGAAYLPLDPEYPIERLRFCVRDAGVRVVVTQRCYAHRFAGAQATLLFVDDLCFDPPPVSARSRSRPDALAYVIYTSGSTGQPKGVMVTHANVVNFFAGMDDHIDTSAAARWLAVTSTSFDISVLELLWTLTRGLEVVLHRGRDLRAEAAGRSPSFSLFHFASGMDATDPQPYHLILEAAKFADVHGFEAIWSPERHFHDFGAPYPNPSVMNSAIATITTRLQLRAGSVVLPLHSPFRVAEEWALVDQLSQGRIGIAFASGWQPNDFVLARENYEDRKNLMFELIEQVRTLWRGEKIAAVNPKGDSVMLGTFPRPVQNELPVWITAAGSPETFERAGSIGANVLTHMLGQSLNDLREQVRRYRDARAGAGLDPATGRVTVMVHTFIGPDTDTVREQVRQPLKDYLKSSASLVGNYADAWSAYKRGAGTQLDASAIQDLDDAERNDLYEFAFERYFESSGLFGSVEKALPLGRSLREIGVDEIACLIDFGVAPALVLQHLPFIEQLKSRLLGESIPEEADIVQDIERHGITHMQCTPSLARMIPMLTADASALRSLRQLLVGGEALPLDLVRELYQLLPEQARIINMYGPTETTIWSTAEPLSRDADRITIGHPIANTRCYVLDRYKQPVPVGRVGELHIAGAGVAAGYHARPELNGERFLTLALPPGPERVYATGDLVRELGDGRYEYLGRADFQVKVRGHRIELGEIESALRQQPGIVDAVVVAREDTAGTQQLVGFVVPAAGVHPDLERIRLDLRDQLPDHLIPGRLVQLSALPMTPNGKVDRNALPSREAGSIPRAAGAPARPPATDVERQIKDVWERVLNVDGIGVNDNFFEVGGHSILAVKVQSALSRLFGERLPIIELFRRPTIARLAAYFADDEPSDDLDRVQGRADARRAALSRRATDRRPRGR